MNRLNINLFKYEREFWEEKKEKDKKEEKLSKQKRRRKMTRKTASAHRLVVWIRKNTKALIPR